MGPGNVELETPGSIETDRLIAEGDYAGLNFPGQVTSTTPLTSGSTASGGEGKITVHGQTSADVYETAGQVATALGACASLFVPETGTLDGAVSHRGEQKAEIQVYKVAPPLPDRKWVKNDQLS